MQDKQIVRLIGALIWSLSHLGAVEKVKCVASVEGNPWHAVMHWKAFSRSYSLAFLSGNDTCRYRHLANDRGTSY